METRLVLVTDSGLQDDQTLLLSGQIVRELLLADHNIEVHEMYVERVATVDELAGVEWPEHVLRNHGDTAEMIGYG